MFGGLHIEMTALRSLGSLPGDSGFSTSDALHTRQHVYGAGLWCASLKRRVLLNGNGNKKETAGAPYGLHSHQFVCAVNVL